MRIKQNRNLKKQFNDNRIYRKRAYLFTNTQV